MTTFTNMFKLRLSNLKNRLFYPDRYKVEQLLEQARQCRNAKAFAKQKNLLLEVLALNSGHEFAYRELFVALRRTRAEREEFESCIGAYEKNCESSKHNVYRLLFYRRFGLWEQWRSLLEAGGISGDEILITQEKYALETLEEFPLDRVLSKLDKLTASLHKVTCAQLQAMIREFSNNGSSFSLLRIGDGEGTCIGLHKEWMKTGAFTAKSQLAFKLVSRLVFKENSLNTDDLTAIASPLKAAYLHAKVLQLPAANRLTQLAKNDWRGYFGLASAIDFLHANKGDLKTQYYIDQNDVREFTQRNSIQSIVQAHPQVGLITCHQELQARFKKLGAQDVKLILIPEETLALPVEMRAKAEQLYPKRHKEVLQEIAQTDEPRLYFVGAGILAKQYCEALSNAGHIAIDLGSTVDKWLGISKRADSSTDVGDEFIL